MGYKVIQEATYKEPHYCKVPGGTIKTIPNKEHEGTIVQCDECGKYILCRYIRHVGHMWTYISGNELAGLNTGLLEVDFDGRINLSTTEVERRTLERFETEFEAIKRQSLKHSRSHP